MKKLFKVKNKYFFAGVGILVVSVAVVCAIWSPIKQVTTEKLNPYFTYEDVTSWSLPSSEITKELTLVEVFEWDERIFAIVAEEKLSSTDASKLYAYITTAEHDMYALAQARSDTRITISPLIKEVLCEFLTEACDRLIVSSDPYSVALSKKVMERVRLRIQEDKAQSHPYSLTNYHSYWDESKTYSGVAVGSWKTWSDIEPLSINIPAPPVPESAEGMSYIKEVYDRVSNLTESEKDAVITEAKGKGTGTVGAEVLIDLARLEQNMDVNIARVLRERMIAAQAVMDSLIVAYDIKYTYWYPRPEALNSSIVPIINTPNHPSYPSTSATVAATGAMLIKDWYPKESAGVDVRLRHVLNARVDAGIHTQNDVDTGTFIGKQVAEMYLELTR